MPEDLLNDLESFGLFFEDMAVRDLRIYTEIIDCITGTMPDWNVTL